MDKPNFHMSFLVTVLAVWTAMHLYVFWRAGSAPWIGGHLPAWSLWLAAFLGWVSYPLARILESRGWDGLGIPLEWLAANWIGVLFLLMVALLATDVVTLGGWLLPQRAPEIRGGAVILALGLSAVALTQGLRPPVVRDYEVRLAGLPRELDGTVVAHISDLHLGTLIGQRWLSRLVAQVNALEPDLILAVGDVIDGNASRVARFVPELRQLRAPLGVYAVTGNHEYYAGLEASVAVFLASGFKVLRGEWTEAAPGLIIAGVDDLTVRAQFGSGEAAFGPALAGRPPGGAILLSHTPAQIEAAAAAGAGLMVSGHTHNGQIWPFTYLVKSRYPRIVGRYDVEGMAVVVSRGAGTWGPRMRLWRLGEILRITLRSA